MIPARALRLERYDAVTLDRQAFLNGEVFYDGSNNTLRLFDGKTTGGRSIATQNWTTTNFASLTAVTTNNTTINSAIALKAPIASPTFTGTVTGTFSGNVTGAVTGNASTATKLATARNINGLAFDGSANISVSTLVNGANTITLNSSGNLVLPGANGGGLISSTGYNYASTVGSLIIDGDQVALDYRGNNNLFVDEFGIEFYTNTTGTSGFNASISADNYWAFAPDGTTYLPGDIIATTGTVTASTVTASTVTASAVTTTNDVTVGTNVNISTLPTLTQHATNKKYVDARSVAMSIALS